MNNLKVVFILDHALMPYRIPFFEQLSKQNIELTIIHPGKIYHSNYFLQINSKQIRLPFGIEFRRYNYPFKNADIVVHMQNIRIINLWLMSLNPFRNYKLIHWGIGASSSKGLVLKKNMISLIRNLLSKFSSAIILYSSYTLPLFSKSMYRKIFIANNTIYNPTPKDFSDNPKDSIIFIGSLNKRKGLDELLTSFKEILFSIDNQNLKLNIVGDGEEMENLKKLAIDLGIQNSVNFLGKITSYKIKEVYFRQAYACISPKQAGLAVLESFSYGVPFICHENSISGGEHFNIINDYNGYLVSSDSELTQIIKKIVLDKATAKKLGKNAFNYYCEKRNMELMVGAFINCFNFVLRRDIKNIL